MTGHFGKAGCSTSGVRIPGFLELMCGPRKVVNDPWGTPVSRGQFAYHSTSGRFIRVVPCDGARNIPMAARIRLLQRTSKRLCHLVINADAADAMSPNAVNGLISEFDADRVKETNNEFVMDGGATRVSILTWQTPDVPFSDLPPGQTL